MLLFYYEIESYIKETCFENKTNKSPEGHIS
jgi:hypothetical protein